MGEGLKTIAKRHRGITVRSDGSEVRYDGEGREVRRYRCPVCAKFAHTYVPRGGDGSAIFFKRHRDAAGGRCDGANMEAL